MSTRELVLLISHVVGGLAIFLFGLQAMTGGLRAAAGDRLRGILAQATNNRPSGYLFGTTFGLLAHSSATTSMLVIFVNAGLLSLSAAIPPVLGANFGTTLSMQVLSLDIAAFCFIPIALGFAATFMPRFPTVREAGRALFGFGLIFLGMSTMSGAVEPHRALFVPWLQWIDGNTIAGLLGGIAVSAAVTAAIQSSGATLGMCFALVSAGVFTDLAHVYPIILGAHIGTCATPLLACVGTGRNATRLALFHLIFNLFNVTLAALLAPVALHFIPMLQADLARQIANTHSLVMLTAGALVLPLTAWAANAMQHILPGIEHEETTSQLDEELLDTPETALKALIAELQRICGITRRNLELDGELLRRFHRQTDRAIVQNEQSINEIKQAANHYIKRLTRRYLSRRQIMLMQLLDRCVAEAERIGDHVDAFREITLARHGQDKARFDEETLKTLVRLYARAVDVLNCVYDSLNPEIEDFQKAAQGVLDVSKAYTRESLNAKSLFASKVAEHLETPAAAVYFGEYIAALDRAVRHAKRIALAESHPDFWIKRAKLDRLASKDSEPPPPEEYDEGDFLDRLQREGYL